MSLRCPLPAQSLFLPTRWLGRVRFWDFVSFCCNLLSGISVAHSKTPPSHSTVYRGTAFDHECFFVVSNRRSYLSWLAFRDVVNHPLSTTGNNIVFLYDRFVLSCGQRTDMVSDGFPFGFFSFLVHANKPLISSRQPQPLYSKECLHLVGLRFLGPFETSIVVYVEISSY